MFQFFRSWAYQLQTSRSYNLTITKNIIKYDTTVNLADERPSMDTYSIRTLLAEEYENSFPSATDRFAELNFYPENMYNEILIQKIKAN